MRAVSRLSVGSQSTVLASCLTASLVVALCLGAATRVQAQVLSMPSEANNAPAATQAVPALPQIIINGRKIDPTLGTVETVSEVKTKAKPTGLGAIAGGVIGGVVAGKLGGANANGGSKTTARVLSAVGGGLLGHYLERQVRTRSTYAVAVRMDDGSLKTVSADTIPAIGSRVVVDASGLRSAGAAAQGGAAASQAPQAAPNSLPDTRAPVMQPQPLPNRMSV
jgi:outer membrane lipoprotein SlyB